MYLSTKDGGKATNRVGRTDRVRATSIEDHTSMAASTVAIVPASYLCNSGYQNLLDRDRESAIISGTEGEILDPLHDTIDVDLDFSNNLQDLCFNNESSLERQEQRIKRVSELIANVNRKFPEASSSFSRQQYSGHTSQPLTAYAQMVENPWTTARSPAEYSILHDQNATKLSSTIASPVSVFNGPTRTKAQEESFPQGSGADAFGEESPHDEAWKKNYYRHGIEASIHRVLSDSTEHAKAIVSAFHRRLQGFTSQNCDASGLPALLASAFESLYDHSENEVVEHGSSSAENQTTGPGVEARLSPTVAPVGSAIQKRLLLSLKRGREEDEKDPRNPSKNRKPCHIVSEKHWLCPYGVRYQKWATGACRTPTKFRSFSELKNHLRLRHRINSHDREELEHPELYMSNQQWDNIEIVANEASKKRPKQGTEASFGKQLGMFRAVWRILFPDAGPGPKSPFCEDFIVDEIGMIGMLSESIFDSRSQQAFERGDISSPNEYRANRAEFTESMQQLFAIVEDYRPEIADLVRDLVSSTASGIIRSHQMELSGTSVDEGSGPSCTAADTLMWESAESSELTATSSRSGSGNSPQTSSSYSVLDLSGGFKIDNEGPQQGIEPTMLHLNAELAMLTTNLDPGPLHSEFMWPSHGTGSLHTRPGSSQSSDNRQSQVTHIRAPLSDPVTSHQLELGTLVLDYTMERSTPFHDDFYSDWKEGKQEDSASTSAYWDKLPFSQPDEDTTGPWHEFFNI